MDAVVASELVPILHATLPAGDGRSITDATLRFGVLQTEIVETLQASARAR